ncbi:hypothetical protein MRX96_041271 [Rhipicephalus microplus]
MQVDAGGTRSIIIVNEFRELQQAKKIKVDKCDAQLVTWTKEGLDVLGEVSAPVKFKDRELQWPLLIFKDDGNTLLVPKRKSDEPELPDVYGIGMWSQCALWVRRDVVKSLSKECIGQFEDTCGVVVPENRRIHCGDESIKK